ncbi:MAG: hypothetical protein Q8K92_26655 [Leadbetterella sp.]|nr:hypothetical protein [Leadbetterella sp.]
MRILASLGGVRTIYDTANPDYQQTAHVPIKGLTPLHHTHMVTDLEYLEGFFPEDHPIFNNFTKTFYYYLPS